MRQARGFSLVELMVVLAGIGLLVAVVIPIWQNARDRARLALCQANQRTLGAGLWCYATENKGSYPPFAFSSIHQPDLPLSGHWGGTQDTSCHDHVGQKDVDQINLYVLAHERYVSQDVLLCPGSQGDFDAGRVSFFPGTEQFSTYCLRFPYSEDLFTSAPELAHYEGRENLLQVYCSAASGHKVPIPYGLHQTVPFLNMRRRYRTGSGVFSPASDAIVADAFWRQGDRADATEDGAMSVVRRPYHGRRYNVLFGHGSVVTVTDSERTVEENSIPAGAQPPAGEAPFASQAEAIWSFFDEAG